MPWSAFLSYSQSDQDIASRVRRALFDADLHVTTASTALPGEAWTLDVVDQIRSADVFVPLVSRSYLSSSRTFSELSTALGSDKLIVPILVEKGVRPPEILRPYGYLDMSDPAKVDQVAQMLRVSILMKLGQRNFRSSSTSLESTLQAAEETLLLEEYRSKVRAEELQRRTAMLTLVATTLTLLATLIFALVTRSSSVATALASAVTGLLGAATGFYFGVSQGRRLSDPSPPVRNTANGVPSAKNGVPHD